MTPAPRVTVYGTTVEMRRLYRDLRTDGFNRHDARHMCAGAANIGWGAQTVEFRWGA